MNYSICRITTESAFRKFPFIQPPKSDIHTPFPTLVLHVSDDVSTDSILGHHAGVVADLALF